MGRSAVFRTWCVVVTIVMSSFVSSCFHFLRNGSVTEEKDVGLNLADLSGARFYDGMTGAENIYLDPDSLRVFVTTLEGRLYLLDGKNGASLRKIGTLTSNGYFLGIDRGSDGEMIVAMTENRDADHWKKVGGHLARVAPDLSSFTKVTGNYPAINGLACTDAGVCYFASSNFSFIAPKGSIYKTTLTGANTLSSPTAVIPDMGLANGLFFDRATKQVLFSDTFEVVGVVPNEPRESDDVRIIYQKAALKEAFDDICTDSKGLLWMTDPVKGTIKVYDPESDVLIRYFIKGFGQASSCRIRLEGQQEYLYITELVAPNKDKDRPFNGRGVLRVSLDLLKATRSGDS